MGTTGNFKRRNATFNVSFDFRQVDFPTFMTLTDDDLQELGIGALGARKKMLLAIQGGLYYLADMVNSSKMHERCMET